MMATTSTETTQINLLSDSQNFGEWKDKINEIIKNNNDVNDNLKTIQNYVDYALKHGLISNTISSVAYNNYDSYTESGVYYVNTNKNCPKENVATHLYVAKDELNIIHQLAITLETNTEIYVRCKPYQSNFTSWNRTLTNAVADTLYLSLNGDAINGTISGNVSIDGITTLNAVEIDGKLKNPLEVNGVANFNDNITISKGDTKFVVNNNTSHLTINSNEAEPVQYYIQNDNSVSTDIEGKNVIYYIDDINNTMFAYAEKLRLKYRSSEVHNVDENGNTLPSIQYYIQQNNEVSDDIDGGNSIFRIEGNKVFPYENGIISDKPEYYYIDDKFYEYTNLYTIIDNVLIDNEGGKEVLYIEDSEFVKYIPKLYFVYKPNDTTRIPVFVTDKNPSGLNFNEIQIKYYFKNNSITADEDGLNVLWTISGNKLIPYGDNKEIFPTYYIRNENTEICYREVWYNVIGDVATRVDDISAPLKLYINDSNVISLNTIHKYSVKHLKEVLLNENNRIEYYVQRDRDPILLTSDEAGERVFLYWQGSVVTADLVGTNIRYYYKDGIFSTKNIVYYINKDNTISDKQGNIIYSIENNKIVFKKSALSINFKTNTCDINGTSLRASYLTPEGLTNSYLGEESGLAASGLAIYNLHKFCKEEYIPYEGGTFIGEVIHNNDIILGVKSTQTEERCKIQSYGELLFHCLENTSIVANSTACELYLDRKNELEAEEFQRPCIIGARTRSGTSELQIGQLVYALGCVEFYEDKTVIRHRKLNVGDITNEETNVAVMLEKTDEKTSFRPSVDRAISLGTGAMRYDQVFCVSGEISTSDKNLKTKIAKIDDTLLDKWEKVEWKSFKLKDSVDKKSSNARIHTGLIAQDVEKTLKGVDIEKYGFFCKDSWEDIYDSQYITDSEGNSKELKSLVKSAGEQYSIRYQEAQAIENAYLRRKINSLEKQIEELKNLIQK